MYIGDLHIHSRYSRATSKELTPEHLDLWAGKKGINIVGTGDFTHPAWRSELAEKLEPAEQGLYMLKKEYSLQRPSVLGQSSPRFVISGEISSIYKKNGRVRKVHSLILLPSLEAAEVLSRRLEAIGNIHSDGRPILGLDCHDLLAITLEACPDAIYVPAHIWTPHFSLFGAFSGFDTIEECYEELTPQIHALETGLSSDPAMNWRLSALDSFQLISNSDAHSPSKLGREASLFDIPMSYAGLYGAIQRGEGLKGTIEFFPEEGKYHFDGHRKCHLCLSPSQARKYNGICPVCGRKLTTGVLHRIEQLADRDEDFLLPQGRPFENLVPLGEVIATSVGSSPSSVKVSRQYEHLLEELGNEFYILRQAPLEDISHVAGSLTAEGIRHLRDGRVQWRPGYDGEYGAMRLFQSAELDNVEGQLCMTFDTAEADLHETMSPAIPGAADLPASHSTPVSHSIPVPHGTPASRETAVSNILTVSMPSSALNQDQQQAVESVFPVTAVIAGPGTGKTKTLVSRIEHLIGERGVRPSEITAVTFTNKAAKELTQRIRQALPGKRSLNQMQVGTFHSLCYRLLAQAGIELSLADQGQAEECAGETIAALELACTVKQFLTAVSLHKAGLTTAEGIAADMTDGSAGETNFSLTPEAAARYQQALDSRKLMDFDDLLLNMLRLLEQEQKTEYRKQHFSYLLVDEFQDINPVQYQLIKAWNKGGRELFVIGDPDQSIYGFRGSDSRCFDLLEQDFPGTSTIRLTTGYRSTPEILSASLPLISRNPGGERRLSAARPHGEPVRLVTAETSLPESIFIAKEINRMVGGIDMLDAHSHTPGLWDTARSFADIAVLYRTNHQARLLEQCLQKEGIPYMVAGREDYLDNPAVQGTISFFGALLKQSGITGDTLELCRKRISPSADYSGLEERFLPRLKKDRPWKLLEDWISCLGLGADKSMDTFVRMSYFHKTMEDMLNTLAFGQAHDLKRSGQNSCPSDAVTLMTLHASKGLEFPVVFLYGLKQGILPLKTGKGPVELDEERRLMYVGMTRARDELILTTSEEPSSFLGELPKDACRVEKAQSSGSEIKQLSLFDFM
ncbi:UvrD-helicase domain-containing protein [Enterocloster clostridioformis]|uniref:UvrD-helicase domain-containing protein n=1 Tax=Enterocloster clostridioformis TaxID=1531 RepID=UPI0004194E94|nr:UvrD-helicase domain-containing protein [Enterocloster clostridioformis]